MTGAAEGFGFSAWAGVAVGRAVASGVATATWDAGASTLSEDPALIAVTATPLTKMTAMLAPTMAPTFLFKSFLLSFSGRDMGLYR